MEAVAAVDSTQSGPHTEPLYHSLSCI